MEAGVNSVMKVGKRSLPDRGDSTYRGPCGKEHGMSNGQKVVVATVKTMR
jgi:hypothetical protein